MSHFPYLVAGFWLTQAKTACDEKRCYQTNKTNALSYLRCIIVDTHTPWYEKVIHTASLQWWFLSDYVISICKTILYFFLSQGYCYYHITFVTSIEDEASDNLKRSWPNTGSISEGDLSPPNPNTDKSRLELLFSLCWHIRVKHLYRGTL